MAESEAVIYAELRIDNIAVDYPRDALRQAVWLAQTGQPVYLSDKGERVARIVALEAE